MSVKQENRWSRRLYLENQSRNDRDREIEAAFMERGERRQPEKKVSTEATRRQCRAWMQSNAEEYKCSTQIAEAANISLELPHGALDDPEHWVWDEAYLAMKQYE